MVKVEIYILTHKKFNEEYDPSIYKPLLLGSEENNGNYGYIKDNTGDNISNLNPYFAELTGEYWAWKNSKADIIGFCHYRRWFVKNLKYEKLTKAEIINDLNDYDIILPQKSILNRTIYNTVKNRLKITPDYGPKIEDYDKLTKVIKEKFPEYYDVFMDVMHGKEAYENNMFICNKKLSDRYLEWLFEVLNTVRLEIDLNTYAEGNKRVFGFMSELLLNVYVKKHELKIKEHYLYCSERKFPIVHIIGRRCPRLRNLEYRLANL